MKVTPQSFVRHSPVSASEGPPAVAGVWRRRVDPFTARRHEWLAALAARRHFGRGKFAIILVLRARYPSGQGEVCKTSNMGSIPIRASIFVTPSATNKKMIVIPRSPDFLIGTTRNLQLRSSGSAQLRALCGSCGISNYRDAFAAPILAALQPILLESASSQSPASPRHPNLREVLES